MTFMSSSFFSPLKKWNVFVLNLKIHYIGLTCEGKGLTECGLTLGNTLTVACYAISLRANNAKFSQKEESFSI